MFDTCTWVPRAGVFFKGSCAPVGGRTFEPDMKPKTDSSTAKFLATSLVLVMVLNVLVQMIMVSTTPLSRWQGGGFGMYTDPHPYSRTVSIRSLSGERLYTVGIAPAFGEEAREKFWDVLPFPTKKKAQHFFEHLTADLCNHPEVPLDGRLCVPGGEFNLEVRSARVDPSNMSIVRDLIFSVRVGL